MKKVLFPTEFAPHAGQMFRYALDLARKYNAELLAMNAYGRPEGYAVGDDEVKRKRVLEKLHALAAENTPEEYRQVKVRFITELEYPADAILDVAEKEQVDIIVLGMTGHSDDASRHLGSNALRVIRASSCPVLAIPSSAVFQPVKQIVFTTNFEFDDLLVIDMLQQTFDAEIHLIHVVEKPKEKAGAETNMAALKNTFAAKKNMHFQVLEGKDVEEEIDKFVTELNPDLLVMTSHRRSVISFLLEGSTARNIAKQTKTPLLVFKS